MEIYEWIMFLTVFGEVASLGHFEGCMNESTYGYGYLHFFDVDVLQKKNPAGSEPLDPKARFYLEFYVRASQNAHILLAEKNHEPVGLEILLGGGTNTFNQIRKLTEKTRSTLKTEKRVKTVSGDEERGFWIEIDSLDNLLVGNSGESAPFLHYHLRVPSPVRYFSFATWTNIKGKWYFACQKNPQEGADEYNTTVTQRMKDVLFTNYDPIHFPQNDEKSSLTIQLYSEVNSLYLNEKRGVLEISGIANLKWNDWKLRWDPKDYDNVDTIYVNAYRVWTPMIKVLNTATFEKTRFLLKGGSVSIKNTGEINWRVPFLSITFCHIGYKKWPYDRHNCTLVIGFSVKQLKLSMETVAITTVVSKWKIQNLKENGTVTYIGDGRDCAVEFHLQRRNPSAIIQNFIVPPFLSAATLTLLSFWMDPSSAAKLFLCSGSVFILIVTFTVLANTLPNVLSSQTASFYHLTVFFYAFPVLFLISLKYLPNSVSLPQLFAKFLRSRINEILLCFPQIQQNQPSKLKTEEEIECSNDALLLGIFYERLIFFIYLTCFVVVFVTALFFSEMIL